MAASTTKEIELAEQRKYRKFSAQQKLEIVLAGLRGDRSVRDVSGRALGGLVILPVAAVWVRHWAEDQQRDRQT